MLPQLRGTPMLHRAVSQDAIWFAGAGVAMIALGLLNLAPESTVKRWQR